MPVYETTSRAVGVEVPLEFVRSTTIYPGACIFVVDERVMVAATSVIAPERVFCKKFAVGARKFVAIIILS
jgi:hypothetical protein